MNVMAGSLKRSVKKALQPLKEYQQEKRAIRIARKTLERYKPLSRNTAKQVYIEVRDNTYNRYLYPFIRFFELEGYQVYLPNNLRLIGELAQDMYASFIFQDGTVMFGEPAGDCLIINNLSADYFKPLLVKQEENSFVVPMPQHPGMYQHGLWNQEVGGEKRKSSVFMAGNFDPGIYNDPDMLRLFNVEPRLHVLKVLQKSPYFLDIIQPADLQNFLRSEEDHKVVIIQASNFRIPLNELRATLSKFNFYLALPGMVMPVSHNIIEAMSVDAIPVLQEGYAKLFRPPLEDGVNAMLFKDAVHLDEVLGRIFSLSEKETEAMRRQVRIYYNTYLTPAAIVETIESGKFEKLYLQTEVGSVQLLKKHRLPFPKTTSG